VGFTKENAKELGALGGTTSGGVRRARKRLRADLRAREVLASRAEELARELLKAALGQGPYAHLDAKDRAGFVVKALEYGVGRPRQVDPAPEPIEERESAGLKFGVHAGGDESARKGEGASDGL
jgi:hypothetical protein